MSRALAVLGCFALALSPLPSLAEPTPGVSASQRIVPEPRETNDYVSYAEWRAMLDTIVQAAPDFVEVFEVGASYGWNNTLTGSHDAWPVLAVEVTNEQSANPRDAKQAVVFQLSIHGNEKGGREGGFRIIEDLAIPLGWAQEYRGLLDEVIVVFTFPNVDGWMHEEPPYRANCAQYFPLELPSGECVETQSYVRFNGRLRDMNRDWPTVGWYATDFGRGHAFSEPEILALERYLLQFRGRTLSAADIHGMLNPADGGFEAARSEQLPGPVGLLGLDGQGAETLCLPQNPLGVECAAREGHFVLGLLEAVQADPRLSASNVRIAERTKELLSAMAQEKFPYWSSSPNAGYAGGEWMEWGTTWDTIGYTDSGFTGDWFAQALGAAGLDYEMSYNHITFDNHYVPELNAMHVESTRAIVRGFLDEAREQLRPALRVEGTIAWLGDERALEGQGATQEGPHRDTGADDAYEARYQVSPQRFWEDLARYAPAGSVVQVSAQDVAAGRFHEHATLIIAGDAWDLLRDSPDALRHLRMHLEQGNRLLLTDSALRALEALELAQPGSVEQGEAYLGYVDIVRDHELAGDVRGLARQTYDAIPLGYEPGSAPVWSVERGGLQGADIAGTTGGEDRASFGRIAVGQGEVLLLGALLPTPTQDTYHPYGLASYAVTYTGYQLLYNALGLRVEEHGAEPTEPGTGTPALQRPVPALEPWHAVLAAAMVALAARRRR